MIIAQAEPELGAFGRFPGTLWTSGGFRAGGGESVSSGAISAREDDLLSFGN